MDTKTLLLVFIHGFKGSDTTFRGFPKDLQAVLSHSLPHLRVLHAVYPQFETRGDLGLCVAAFKEWLQNKVIDLEAENSTTSPTINPAVRLILIGHSMGGIVAAETALSIARDSPLSSHSHAPLPTMFPSVLGILAFDTPYLGVAPGVLSQAAEQHYQTARTAWGAYSSVTSALGLNSPASSSASAAAGALKALPPAETAAAAATGGGGWKNWSRVAAYAGAGAAVLAAGAGAAYANRAALGEGLGWAGSHLEFVGTLAKAGELRRRVDGVARELVRARGVGWANLYTVLGAGAAGTGDGEAAARERTFCVVPREEEAAAAFFERAVNEKAEDEVGAHVSMFAPRDNPGYYAMEDRARDLITEWVTSGWRFNEDHHEPREKQATEEEPADEPLVDLEEHHSAEEQETIATETHGKPPQAFANDDFGSNPWQDA